MRYVVLPSDQGGCGYTRLIWPALAIRAAGHDVEIRGSLTAEWRDVLGVPEFQYAHPVDADVVVFQRVLQPHLLALMRSIQEQGVAVVVDLDDDLAALGHDHPTFRDLRPGNPSGRSTAVMKEAMRMADLVTVSTPALAAKYGGRKVVVVPNGIPKAYLSIERTTPRSNVIGWPGSTSMHPGDLQEVGSAVAELCRDGVAQFRAIGDRHTLDILGVPDQQFVAGVALADLSYAKVVAELDVGVVPLRDSAFNAGKSWLKGLEFASLGVPFVASPRAEYVRLGLGYRAERPRDWLRELRVFATTPHLRVLSAGYAREKAAGMTIEGWVAPQALEAWQSACNAKVLY